MQFRAGMAAAEKSTPRFRQNLKAVIFDWGLGLLLVLALGGNAAAQTVCVPPPSGSVSWWDGDAISGTTAFDIIGGEDGTLAGGASTASGKVGAAFSLNAFSLNSNHVRIPSSPSLNPTGSFSIEAWIFQTADGFLHIVAKWADAGTWINQRAYSFHTLPGMGLRWAISDVAHQDIASFHTFDTPPDVITLNTWNHVAATYDQSSGTRRIFVDGLQVATRTDSPITVTSSIADLAIGAWLNSPTAVNAPFQGLIDEVGFYDRALSGSEVQAIFNADSAGKCKGISANAGADQTVDEGNSVNLDGTASMTASTGAPLTFLWQQVAGVPTVPLVGASTATPSFTAPYVTVNTTLTFELTVTDADGNISTDTVDVSVVNVNQPPVADADATPNPAPEGTTVSLDGSNSFDPEDDPLTCTWTQTGVGQPVTIQDPNACTTTFVAPALVVLGGETLTFELEVGDGALSDFATVSVLITHVNLSPTALIAGSPGPVPRDELTNVTLDGSGSSDPEDDSLTFLWVQTAGQSVAILDSTLAVANFDAPAVPAGGENFTFQLTVDDGEFSDMDTIVIAVQNSNDPPNCGGAFASSDVLWPPNHKMKPIDIQNVSDPNGDPITIVVTGVTQDEPVNGLGDGDSSPDAVLGSPPYPLLIRSERSGIGNGRVYEISFTADDGFGGSCQGAAKVSVPHSRKSTAVDDEQTVDSTEP